MNNYMPTNQAAEITCTNPRETQTIKLTEEEIEIMTRPITSKEIELIIKSFLQRKAQNHMVLAVNSTKYVKKN